MPSFFKKILLSQFDKYGLINSCYFSTLILLLEGLWSSFNVLFFLFVLINREDNNRIINTVITRPYFIFIL